jgi:hypothetical protein
MLRKLEFTFVTVASLLILLFGAAPATAGACGPYVCKDKVVVVKAPAYAYRPMRTDQATTAVAPVSSAGYCDGYGGGQWPYSCYWLHY